VDVCLVINELAVWNSYFIMTIKWKKCTTRFVRSDSSGAHRKLNYYELKCQEKWWKYQCILWSEVSVGVEGCLWFLCVLKKEGVMIYYILFLIILFVEGFVETTFKSMWLKTRKGWLHVNIMGESSHCARSLFFVALNVFFWKTFFEEKRI
jgi:hypothetical protein